MQNSKFTKSEKIHDFIDDYNAHLEGLNDELEGIGISPNKMITKFSQVEIENVETSVRLTRDYYEIVNN